MLHAAVDVTFSTAHVRPRVCGVRMGAWEWWPRVPGSRCEWRHGDAERRHTWHPRVVTAGRSASVAGQWVWYEHAKAQQRTCIGCASGVWQSPFAFLVYRPHMTELLLFQQWLCLPGKRRTLTPGRRFDLCQRRPGLQARVKAV